MVHAPDLRGNGRSPGRRGHVGRAEELREDLHARVTLVRAEEPGLPLFLLGNSLGGIDRAGLRPEKIDIFLIAAAPPLGRLSVPAPLLAFSGGSCPGSGSFSVRTGTDLSWRARDPAVRETALADLFLHRRGTARLHVSKVRRPTIARVSGLGALGSPCPCLILHGSADRTATKKKKGTSPGIAENSGNIPRATTCSSPTSTWGAGAGTISSHGSCPGSHRLRLRAPAAPPALRGRTDLPALVTPGAGAAPARGLGLEWGAGVLAGALTSST